MTSAMLLQIGMSQDKALIELWFASVRDGRGQGSHRCEIVNYFSVVGVFYHCSSTLEFIPVTSARHSRCAV